jgi:hypothetical protein
MVGQDLYRVRTASEIVPPFLEAFYDGEQLLIVDFVALLRIYKLPRMIRYGMLPAFVRLGEYTA